MDIEKCLILVGRPSGLLEEASPGQHEGVGALAGLSLPGAAGSWAGGMLASKHPTPQPAGADSLQSPALSQPCSKPEENPVLCPA